MEQKNQPFVMPDPLPNHTVDRQGIHYKDITCERCALDNWDKHKKWIETASYWSLLERWRFNSRDEIFLGEIGKYYAKVMAERKAELTHEEQVQTSKDIGWYRHERRY